MLMSAHDGAIDQGIFIVRVSRQKGQDPLPDTRFGPTAKPFVNIDRVTKPFR